MKRIRQLHLYLGVFFAPAILFFSLTGALQTFGLHENEDGATRPAWIAKFAQVHIHQKYAAPPGRRPAPPRRPEASARPDESRPAAAQQARRPEAGRQGPSTLPLKIFILLMAIGLITTTLLGVYMAFKYNRDARIVCALLLLGIVLPLALLKL